MSIQEQIRAKASEYRDYTALNLSKLVQTKSYSAQEEDVCRLIVTLCQEAGFDEVYIDGLGSVIGRVGNDAALLIALDDVIRPRLAPVEPQDRAWLLRRGGGNPHPRFHRACSIVEKAVGHE